MQDRVSLYPGRVTLTPVAGQANTYDMERADSPTQAGTPLSKASLLKDATAAMYGLPASATPNDAFEKIPQMIDQLDVFKPGDTLSTVRTDLGDKWLLCNGASISYEDYPDFPASPSSVPSLAQKTDSAAISASGVACYNGTWVAIGSSVSGGYPYIYIANSPSGPWEEKQLASSYYMIRGISCYQGTWVIVGVTQVNNRSCPFIYTSTDPSGTWTSKIIDSSEENALWGVACSGGTWVAVGGRSNGGYPVIYTTSTPTGTWTKVSLGTGGVLRSVYCYGGTWVAVSDNGEIYTATTPSGSWTAVTLPVSNKPLYGVFCYNGTWVAAGRYFDDRMAYIFTATNPSGPWAYKVIGTTACYVSGVTCANGTWVIAGYDVSDYPYILTTSDPTGAWIERTLSSSLKIDLMAVASSGSVWTAVGDRYSGSNLCVYSNSSVALPTISVDGVYTYIKAKE